VPSLHECPQVSPWAAAEIQYFEWRFRPDVAEQGVDVLRDVMMARAFPEGFGPPCVRTCLCLLPPAEIQGSDIGYNAAASPLWRASGSIFRFASSVELRSIQQTYGSPLNTDTSKFSPKAQIDALLLKLPGVSAKKIGGLDAYFIKDRMFACISGDGVGLRLPAATARELQFSRGNVVPFQPGGMASSKEWIQINRADAAEYEMDLELFKTALEFVKGAGAR